MNDYDCISDTEREKLNKRLIAEQTNCSGKQREEYDMYLARMSMQSSEEEAKENDMGIGGETLF